jgi:hypothetical protein
MTLIRGISPGDLRTALETEPDNVLVVDCRPFISYNADHIQSAANMYCPPILKRRLAQGNCHALENTLPSESRRKLRSGYYKMVVVYNDLPSLEMDDSDGDSDICIVHRSLSKFVGAQRCFYLQGKDGFMLI